MAQLNFNLSNASAPGPVTRRPGPSKGQGLQLLGRAFEQSGATLARLAQQSTNENPEVALNLYIDQTQRLKQGVSNLKRIKDGLEFTNASNAFIKDITKQFGEEMTANSVAKKGAEKMGPALIAAMDDIQAHRTMLLGVSGQNKLAAQREKFRASLANNNITIGTIQTSADGVGISNRDPILEFSNQSQLVSDLIAFNTTAFEIAGMYELDLEVVRKSLDDDQDMMVQEMIALAAQQLPEDIVSPKFKNIPMKIKQVFLDPVTQKLETRERTLLPSERVAMSKAAYSNLSQRQTQEEFERRDGTRLSQEHDDILSGDIVGTFGSIPLDDLIEGVAIGTKGLRYELPKERASMLTTLYDVKKAGGFARTDNEELFRQLDERIQSGEPIPPRELIQASLGLSQRTYNTLRDTNISNMRGEKTDYQREVGVQQNFIDDFLGNLKFTSSQGELPAQVASITKQIFRNRANELEPGQRTSEKLGILARQAIISQAPVLFDTLGFKTKQATLDSLAQFDTAQEVDAALADRFDIRVQTREDAMLAKDLLSLKRLGEIGQARRTPPPRVDEKKKLRSFTESLGDIFDSLKNALTGSE